MTKTYERTCTRAYSLDHVRKWYEAEKSFGLESTIFICEAGKVTQYVDTNEGDIFHAQLQRDLDNQGYFDKVCEDFHTAIESQDVLEMFKGLTVFDEIDTFPSMVEPETYRRMLRVRLSTESKIYDFDNKQGSPLNYVLYKGRLFS